MALPLKFRLSDLSNTALFELPIIEKEQIFFLRGASETEV